VSISKAVEAVVVCVCALSFALMSLAICMLLITGNGLVHHDAMSFWTAGQLFAHGKNPYDAAETLRIQREAGLGSTYDPLILRNPPFALPLVVPLGYLSQRWATLVWSALLLAAFALSVRLLWDVFGRPKGLLRWVPYGFAPALICILVGQSAILPLLGLALFFRYHRTHPFAAGAALWLCMLKPHLLLPFAAVLLLWTIRERRFRMLAGSAVALSASIGIAWALDPHAWSQYATMAGGSRVEQEYIPCISVALRLWLRPEALWLQWLPCVIGSAFAVVYYWRRRASWNWNSGGGLLLLVSVLVAPYAWVSDTALALPALMYAATKYPSRVMLLILAVLMALMEGEALRGTPWHSPLYLWPAPAWLVWYLWNNALGSAAEGPRGTQEPATMLPLA
jgi:hypothetical protein